MGLSEIPFSSLSLYSYFFKKNLKAFLISKVQSLTSSASPYLSPPPPPPPPLIEILESNTMSYLEIFPATNNLPFAAESKISGCLLVYSLTLSASHSSSLSSPSLSSSRPPRIETLNNNTMSYLEIFPATNNLPCAAESRISGCL